MRTGRPRTRPGTQDARVPRLQVAGGEPGEVAPNKCNGEAPKWVWYVCPETVDPSILDGMTVWSYVTHWFQSFLS